MSDSCARTATVRSVAVSASGCSGMLSGTLRDLMDCVRSGRIVGHGAEQESWCEQHGFVFLSHVSTLVPRFRVGTDL